MALSHPSAALPTPLGKSSEFQAANRRVLVIDDNPAIHNDFRKVLATTSPAGKALAEDEAFLFGQAAAADIEPHFEVDGALQGQEGLALVTKALAEQRPYAMAFVDIRMPPGWDGIETVSRIWEVCPQLQVALCSAYSDYSWEGIGRRLGHSDRLLFLKKPFDNMEARQLAFALTQKWNLEDAVQRRLQDLNRLVQEKTSELERQNAQLQQEAGQRILAAERESRLNRILENSLNEIYVFDAGSWRLLQVNRGARTNLGYSPQELTALTLQDLHPELSAGQFAELVRPLLSGAQEKIQFSSVHRRKDGTLYPVEVHLQLLDLEKQRVGAAIVLDITERKNLETQLRQSQKMEAIGQLAGGIAHDFNNMLFVITGYTDLVMAGLGKDSPHFRKLQQVKQAADRVTALTQQLLAYGRRQVMELRPLDLNLLVNESLEMLRRLIGPRIAIEFHPAPAAAAVLADATQLQQALINLCLNARDAIAEDGRISVRLRSVEVGSEHCSGHPGARPGSFVSLEVADTGAGIQPEHLNRIFDPFFTTKDVGKGSGLGLSMVQGMVTQHGGFITVESSVGQGTTLTLFLPRTQSVPKGSAQASPVPRKPDQTGRTLLLADDEQLVRELMAEALREAGYRVLEARDGQEALRLFRENRERVDLAILDVAMPNLDGGKTRKELLALQPDLPVILTSGYSPDSVHQGFVLEPGVTLLQKPYLAADLLQAVRAAKNSRSP